MTTKDSLSMNQLKAVLDNAPVAVFVSATRDYRLLYTNRLARELFPEAGRTDAACYAVAGFDKPCPSCHAGEMSRTELRVREYHHPGNHRIYQLSGKLIDWAGEPAHIEYFLDITDEKREKENHRKAEKDLRTTLGSLPCGLCVYRLEGSRIIPVFHNQAFYEMTGYSQEHIRSVERETNYLGVHPEDLAPLQKKIEEVSRSGGVIQHIYRLWNDKRNEYRWIRLDGSFGADEAGQRLLYGVYSDFSEQKRLEEELTGAGEKMQDIINAIPGGVAIYRVSSIFETMFFSDGVPELSGYTVEEYKELTRGDAAKLTYPEDTAMVVEKLRTAIKTHTVADFEFRKLHRDGHIVWVHIQAKQIGEDSGYPLLHCVFHNISALRDTQMELNHLVNSIPGGIASYRVDGGRVTPLFMSDGVPALTGHTREEYNESFPQGILDNIYEPDRARVFGAGQAALESGGILDISYRVCRKDGTLGWIHLNGRRMGPPAESMRFYAVYTGMSEESHMYQSIANETADGIYVIDRASYELLYVNESRNLFGETPVCAGQKCYTALFGKSEPCAFCTLGTNAPDGQEHAMPVGNTGRFYTTRFKESNWNGIPAYIKYVQDVTGEVTARLEKERLELYFQTLVENLPGGISVIRSESDGVMTPEFISDGFAAMTHMSVDEAYAVYAGDIFAGFHPDDVTTNRNKLLAYMESGEGHCELTARMKRGDGGYVWVKSTLSMLKLPDGQRRIYSVYTDISKAMAENRLLRRQYENLLLQHYRAPGPDTLIVGHCNITRNKILEIKDYTDSRLLEKLGENREAFFTGIADLVVEKEERQTFLNTYLNAPSLAAFARKEAERVLDCFIKLPGEERGRYVRFKVNMVETPDTGDITGILTVTDITEQTISDRILHRLSSSSHDYIVDLNLHEDSYQILSSNKNAHLVPQSHGRHSERVAHMAASVVVPRDREQYRKALEPDRIIRRLKEQDAYTVAYSVTDEDGEIRTKNMSVFASDLRLGRICLVCTDITDSVREQQGLLNMIAYTFDLAGFLHVGSGLFTMYTRRMVLENLPPYRTEDLSRAAGAFTGCRDAEQSMPEAREQFRLETMLNRLAQKPAGYDFVFPCRTGEGGLLYKQVNVLWGDQNHGTICIVRADVTDMLAAERASKKALEDALALAREASQAKSDFLTSMSHDIRTPMNAIMGMTTLALAYLDDRERVKGCLERISVANKHLLSLINDVLDMSRIERSKITLSQRELSLYELIEQLSAIMEPQAREAGLRFVIQPLAITHERFLGDSLRISQILINLLSNAVKFTPEGGQVDFLVEETPALEVGERVRYRFTIRDTGIGMSETFLTRIFEPFARDASVVRVEGTGLGLSIVKGLVELMDGEIMVSSHVGKGTAFRVELEFETARRRKDVDERGEKGSGASGEDLLAGRTFLIAEDNMINAELLSELLQMHGAKSIVSADGDQVLHAFARMPPGTYDAILMDIQMPKMTGYEATRAIRELNRPDAATIPIVAMTANAFTEDIQASLDAGMNAHVAKPIDVDVLRATLGRLLD